MNRAIKRDKIKEAESRLATVEPRSSLQSVQEVMDRVDLEDRGADFSQFGPLFSYMQSLGVDNNLSDKQLLLLSAYARSGLLRRSCHIAGVSLKSHYNWCKNPEYMEYFEEARKVSGEVLEQLALELASGVYERPLVSQGHIAGYEKIYDTKMLAMVMKARMPERYQQRVDITSGGQSLVKLVDKETWDSV